MSGFHHAFAERKGAWKAFFRWWDAETAGKEERTFEDLPELLTHATAEGWELVGTTFTEGATIHELFFKKPLD